MSYEEAIKSLEKINGKPDFNYFTESSYEKYKKNLAKNINNPNGYYKRRKQEIHHILENKYRNLSNKKAIRKNNIPYYTQKKQHLIYVDIIEHAILHKLIAIEAGEELVNSVSKGIIGRATDVEEIKQKN
ncbi:hypothetical protein [Lactococcus lactis]|uniref:hypothetical protein n=1 Tax=Lactococcus lactis TaxID=1358 RepID=UPI002108A9E1|nr:hypothetical protein [Lactococcus lactis]MCQ4972475.1 hypothetical protein [Lactococcus lactis]MCQ4998281.1 hypothetical protein [Lactococcus lactis]